MDTPPANAMFPEGAVLADELSLPAEGIGNVYFTVATESGNYPAGNNFIVNITLPTGVSIDGPVGGVSDVESDGDEDTVIGLDLYEQLRDEVGNSLTNTSPIGLFTAEIDTDVLVSLGTAAPNGTAAGDPSTYNFSCLRRRFRN